VQASKEQRLGYKVACKNQRRSEVRVVARSAGSIYIMLNRTQRCTHPNYVQPPCDELPVLLCRHCQQLRKSPAPYSSTVAPGPLSRRRHSRSLTASMLLGHTPPTMPSSLAINCLSTRKGLPASAPEPRGRVATRGSRSRSRMSSRCHAEAWDMSQWPQRTVWACCRCVKPAGKKEHAAGQVVCEAGE
jgi:hypothetical protein